MWIDIKRTMITLNLFKKEASISTTVNSVNLAIISTRFYLILLTCSVFALVLFNGLRDKTVSVTVEKPTLDTFERLYNTYTVNLRCPCEQIATPHSTILSVIPSYHQVSKENANRFLQINVCSEAHYRIMKESMQC